MNAARLLASLLLIGALAACSSSEKPTPRPEGPKPQDPKETPPPQEQIVLRKPGSKRASIYAWRQRHPEEVGIAPETSNGAAPVGTGTVWILQGLEYVKTEDFADAWESLYVLETEKGATLSVQVLEYPGATVAQERFDKVVAALESRPGSHLAELSIPKTDGGFTAETVRPGTAGNDERHAVAIARSGPYLFTFDRPNADALPQGFAAAFTGACLTEPPAEPAEPQASPGEKEGASRPRSPGKGD